MQQPVKKICVDLEKHDWFPDWIAHSMVYFPKIPIIQVSLTAKSSPRPLVDRVTVFSVPRFRCRQLGAAFSVPTCSVPRHFSAYHIDADKFGGNKFGAEKMDFRKFGELFSIFLRDILHILYFCILILEFML